MEQTHEGGTDGTRKRATRISFSAMQFGYWAALGTLAFNVQLLKSCGFNSGEVGLLMALNFLAGMVSPPIFGFIADRIGSIKRTFLVALGLTIAVTVLLPLSKSVFIGTFPVIAVMYPTYTLFRAPSNSLLDGWSVGQCNEFGIPYAHVRLFGSLGYAIMASAFTVVANRFGISAVYFIGAVMLAGLWVFSSRQGGDTARRKKVGGEADAAVPVRVSPLILFKNYYFVVFLLFNIALTIASNSAASFMPYILENINRSGTLTGIVGGARAACEIPVMLFAHKLIKRFKLSTMLGITGLIYVCCLFSFQFINTLFGIIVAQCAQGVGFGLYLCSAIQYAFTLAPKELRATAQSLVTTTNFSGSIIASLLGGVLIGAAGIRGMLLVTGIIQGVCLLVYVGSFALGRRMVKNSAEQPHRAA